LTTRDHLRREVVGEMRGERCGEGVEVGAPVVAEPAVITFRMYPLKK
jgi:hypothetical protein